MRCLYGNFVKILYANLFKKFDKERYLFLSNLYAYFPQKMEMGFISDFQIWNSYFFCKIFYEIAELSVRNQHGFYGWKMKAANLKHISNEGTKSRDCFKFAAFIFSACTIWLGKENRTNWKCTQSFDFLQVK